jgi:hypothetical protein
MRLENTDTHSHRYPPFLKKISIAILIFHPFQAADPYAGDFS